jgi:hypothetical protein
MSWHEETITAEQRDVIESLGPWGVERGMYLAGGTAVALQLGHRNSVDLDWFISNSLPDPMRLAGEIRGIRPSLEVVSVDRGTLHCTMDGVRVSIFEYPYPLLAPLVTGENLNCQLASLLDLAAMKLVAISQRGAKKDFIDIYALSRSQLSLDEMLAGFRQKYSVGDVSRVLYSLTYFSDAEEEPSPLMLWNDDWSQIKTSIEKWVADYAG